MIEKINLSIHLSTFLLAFGNEFVRAINNFEIPELLIKDNQYELFYFL